MTTRPSIESLRNDLDCLCDCEHGQSALLTGERSSLSAALTELAAYREREPELARLRLIEAGARDSEALVTRLHGEVDALRAERDTLVKERDGLKAAMDHDARVEARDGEAEIAAYQTEMERLRAERDTLITYGTKESGILRAQLTAANARADALAARVNSLMEFIHRQNSGYPGCQICGAEVEGDDNHAEDCGVKAILCSTPSADLAAHDARVRREALGTSGVEAIAAERKRQMEVEGWTPEHDDDEHGGEQLAAAASAYLLHDLGVPVLDHGAIPCLNRRVWPWGFAWWKPKSYRKNLIRAGALIAAEIDRLNRKASIAPAGAEGGE